MNVFEELISSTPSSFVRRVESAFNLGAASRDAEIGILREQLALAKQVAIQSQEDAKNQYRKCVALEKFIEGKNGYKERIQQLYEENLRLGNEQIDLADKTREECAVTAWLHYMDVCKKHGHSPNVERIKDFCSADAIRATKERP